MNYRPDEFTENDLIYGNIWIIERVSDNITYLTNENNHKITLNTENLFNFIYRNNISIIDRKFKYEIYFSNFKSFKDKKYYEQWLKIKQENENKIIDNKYLKIGYKYQLDKGKSFYYLGSYYIIKYRFDKKLNKIVATKQSKKILRTTYDDFFKYDNLMTIKKS